MFWLDRDRQNSSFWHAPAWWETGHFTFLLSLSSIKSMGDKTVEKNKVRQGQGMGLILPLKTPHCALAGAFWRDREEKEEELLPTLPSPCLPHPSPFPASLSTSPSLLPWSIDVVLLFAFIPFPSMAWAVSSFETSMRHVCDRETEKEERKREGQRPAQAHSLSLDNGVGGGQGLA